MDTRLNRLRTPAYTFAVISATLGLAACGGSKESTEGNRIRIDNGTLYVPGESEGKASAYHCDGKVLVQKLERESHMFEDRGIASDETNRIEGDPICADGVISGAIR